MAYNPYIQQGNSLQGGGVAPLQGNISPLQGGYNPMGQVASPTPAAKPNPAPTAYGTAGATSPKQSYINDLSSRYGLNKGTVYDKTTNQGFSNEQDFFKSAGVNSFNNLKFDTGYTPGGASAPAAAPAAAPVNNGMAGNPLAQKNAFIPTEAEKDPMAPFKTAYQDYIKSLAPSQQVQDAQKAYLDFVKSKELGLQGIEDKVIPMQFITGQKASLENRAQIEAKRLQGDIGLAQDIQTANTAAAKAKSELESTLYGDSQKKAEAAQKFAFDNDVKTPFYEVGGTVYRTSDGKAFSTQGEAFGAGVARDYSNVQKVSKPVEPLTLSEGEAVYDPVTGQFVVKNPKTYDPNNGANTFGGFNLTSGQQNLLNGIINKYNASPLVAAADRTVGLKAAVDAIRKDPGNAAQQLNLSYAYIQALDTYQSAVREGELSNLNSIDSKIGSLQNSVQQIQNGQIVRPEVAKQIADAAESVINAIYDGARAKAQSYKSQASVFGLGDVWDAYTSGFNPTYNSGGGGGSPDDIINKYLQGFNSAGNASASTPYLSTLGSITGLNGSPLWKHGLDIDLKIGQPVRNAVGGTVIAVAPNGGFGNQVKIRAADGTEYWYSHLQKGTVKVGQHVPKGAIIGLGGNSGNTIPGKGGDGSHLDLTAKDRNGNYIPPSKIAQLLKQTYV